MSWQIPVTRFALASVILLFFLLVIQEVKLEKRNKPFVSEIGQHQLFFSPSYQDSLLSRFGFLLSDSLSTPIPKLP